MSGPRVVISGRVPSPALMALLNEQAAAAGVHIEVATEVLPPPDIKIEVAELSYEAPPKMPNLREDDFKPKEPWRRGRPLR